MPINFAKPVTTDNYSTGLLPGLVATQTALARLLDTSLETDAGLTNKPTGIKRYNASSQLFEQWNGSAWGPMPLNYQAPIGFTPYNAANPANYIAASGAPVQSVAGKAGVVSLSASDVGAAPVVHTHSILGSNDTRSVNFEPFAWGGISHHLKSNSADGLSEGGAYHGVLNLVCWSDSSGGNAHQLGFTDINSVWHRSGSSLPSMSAWGRIAKWTDAPVFAGLVYGRGGGAGLGQIIVQAGGSPPAMQPGDLCLIY